MPIYEFECQKCGKEYEELVRAGYDETPPCPKCNSKKIKRKISRTGSVGSVAFSCGTSGFS
jgi:putative FmdB family regulatory protein